MKAVLSNMILALVTSTSALAATECDLYRSNAQGHEWKIASLTLDFSDKEKRATNNFVIPKKGGPIERVHDSEIVVNSNRHEGSDFVMVKESVIGGTKVSLGTIENQYANWIATGEVEAGTLAVTAWPILMKVICR